MIIHQRLQTNNRGEDYFVGDIHGEVDRLIDALASVNFNPSKDRLISTGDLVDRGPDSQKALNLLREPWFFAVRGNHEQLILNRHRGSQEERDVTCSLHELHGGLWYSQLNDASQQQVRAQIDTLPLSISLTTDRGNVGVIHAGWHLHWSDLYTPEHLPEDDVKMGMWMRHGNAAMQASVSGIDLLVAGHQNDRSPRRTGNQFWIDTLLKGGYLTLVSSQTLWDWYDRKDGLFE